MPKYTTQLYKEVGWRKTKEGRFYERMMNNKGFLGKLYKKTFHSPVYVDIDNEFLKRLRLINSNLAILDIGGNIGSFESSEIRSILNKHKYMRLDIDPETKPDILGDARKIPLDSNSIDFVIAKSLFEHITEPWKSINEINRILKPNGILYFHMPFLLRVHASPNDYYRFTEDGLKYHLKKFNNVRIYPRGGYVTTLESIIFTGTYFLDRFFGLGFAIRCLLYPIFSIMVKLDKFDKYNLCTIGYYGFAGKGLKEVKSDISCSSL